MGIGSVDDVHDEVGLGHLLQRGAEGLHEMVREMADKADGVRDGALATTGQRELAHRGVQGGEEGVLHEHIRPRQSIEQAGLARIGVAGDGDRGGAGAVTTTALGTPYPIHVGQLTSQHRHLVADAAAVGLDLGLTRATCADTAGRPTRTTTGLPTEGLTPAAQAREEILHLREGDLRASGATARMLGEDVQDQPGPVHDLDLDDLLQMPELARTQLTVTDHRVSTARHDDVAQLAGLAGSDVGRGVGSITALDDTVEDQCPRGLGEGCELEQTAIGLVRGALGPDTDKHDLLQSDLAVLDLGDVLEFGGQSRDSAQCLSIPQVELTGAEGPVT